MRILGRRHPSPAPFGALPLESPTPVGLRSIGVDLGLGQVLPATGLTRDSEGWELRGEAGTARVVVEGHVPLDEEFSWFEQEDGATLLHGRRDGRRCHVRVQLDSHDPTLELETAQQLLDAVLPPRSA